MSLARYAKKRDANEREIIKALEAAGCQVWQLDRPVDLLCFNGKAWFPLEVKVPGGPMTPSQKRFRDSLGVGYSVKALIVESAEQALDAASRWR